MNSSKCFSISEKISITSILSNFFKILSLSSLDIFPSQILRSGIMDVSKNLETDLMVPSRFSCEIDFLNPFHLLCVTVFLR